jgi:hypothetical protein
VAGNGVNRHIWSLCMFTLADPVRVDTSTYLRKYMWARSQHHTETTFPTSSIEGEI